MTDIESEDQGGSGDVSHLSSASRVPLASVLGGTEPAKMTPGIAANIEVLNEPTSCYFRSDDTSMEVNTLGRSLDILAPAELPGTGEEIAVAVENQYGTADPDHFGRLVGWYMPETGARMGVLIAEGFEPQLVKAVNDGQIVVPEHGIWLVEACGYEINGTRFVTYETRACSLPRAERLRRESIYRRGPAAGRSRSELNEEAERRARQLFGHIEQSGSTWIGAALARSSSRTGYYRTLADNGSGCHVSMFVGTDRITIGSCYLKSNHDEETLALLSTANQETEVDPAPSRRYLRGTWWDIRSDVGRNTEADQLSTSLGAEIETAYEVIRAAIETHQDALLDAVTMRTHDDQ